MILDIVESALPNHRTFQPSGLFAARVDMQGSTPGLHALFTGEDDTREAWLYISYLDLVACIHEIFPEVSLKFAGGASMILKPENYLVHVDPVITVAVSQLITHVISKGTQCYLVTSSINEIFPEVSLKFAGGASMNLKP
ncbi:unnamed protein product [Lactuca virosa]|uniref:Uncharacterized protein n=1 Tax=Lactuca virosa TaxID=75947 RepID=A0AAU9LYA1_9ASTR|nr:unnamed protein product [Lactuca virosa]